MRKFRCRRCGSFSELGPPTGRCCRGGGEHDVAVVHVASAEPGAGGGPPRHGIVTKGWGGPEKKYLLISDEAPSRRGASYLTERIDEYEHAQTRGAAAAVILSAYNNRPRVGPIVVRYSAFGPVYD